MRKARYSASGSCLAVALSLIVGIYPNPARADVSSDDRPIRLYATAEQGPIGKVSSLGAVAINGRVTGGEQLIWGGEILQALSSTGAQVSFDSMGQVRLAGGATVRLGAGAMAIDDNVSCKALIASLISGDMTVRLREGIAAYIEARGSTFTASRGASFRIGVRDSHAEINATTGTVRAEAQNPQRKYVVRPVGISSRISVRTRSSRQFQVRVTDENDKPVPDLPIIFALGSAGAGTLGSGAAAGATFAATTNAQGVATTTFTASQTASSTSISATVQGTQYSWTGQIDVTKSGFWNNRNKTLTGAAAAAATISIIVITNDPGRDRITPVPPPDVIPPR